ncbi:MAG: hypothetical protein ABI894_15920 [Ilumatobacteraceae bacterium]
MGAPLRTMLHDRHRFPRTPLGCIALAVTLVCAVVALKWIFEVVANSGRGLDASDESYYLLSVEFPHSSSSAASGFDSLLAPIWWLSNDSIARFRIAGVLVLIGTLAVVARLCSSTCSTLFARSRPLVTAFIAACLASLSFAFYTNWIPTPGYNLVVLVLTLLIAAMTACLAIEDPPVDVERLRRRVPMEALLALSLCLGIVVKAPAFVVIGVLSIGTLVLIRGAKWLVSRLWSLAAGFLAGAVLFVVLTGSPLAIARRLSRGIHAGNLLGSHTPESLWELTEMKQVYGPWFLKYSLGAIIILLLWRVIRRAEWRLAITTIGSVVTAIVFLRTFPEVEVSGDSIGWWWIRLASMMTLWATANSRARSRRSVLGPLISLMAVGAAAGSGNGLVRQVVLTIGVLGLGLLVHGIVMISSQTELLRENTNSRGWRLALVALPIALFFVVGGIASNTVLDRAIHEPYRLNDTLHAENQRVDLGSFGAIDVHPETARYIRELQAIGARAPQSARRCLVDLAGGTPLSAIALGAKPADVPWVVGGYPGSNQFADFVLSGSPCLSDQFLLIEAPSGRRSIERPAWLDVNGATLLGRVQYSGYNVESQFVWLVPGLP